MKKLVFKKIILLAATLLAMQAQANGRIGSGADGLIYEPIDMPSDAILSIGEFGSIEVRGILGKGQKGAVSIYACIGPKSCKMINGSSNREVNSRLMVPVGEQYLVSLDGVFYPTSVTVKKNQNTVLRLQKVALASTNGQYSYSFSTDYSDSNTRAMYLNIWQAIGEFEWIKGRCEKLTTLHVGILSACAAFKEENASAMVGRAIFFDKGRPTIYDFDYETNCFFEFDNICPLTNLWGYRTYKTGKRGINTSFAVNLPNDAEFISLLPGAYVAEVAGKEVGGIVVPIPE